MTKSNNDYFAAVPDRHAGARKSAGGPSSLYRIPCANLAAGRPGNATAQVDMATARAYPSRPLVTGAFTTGTEDDETYLPAQQNQEEASSRFPCPHGDQGRPAGAEASSGERPRPPHALSPSNGSSGHDEGSDAPRQSSAQSSAQHSARFPRQARLTTGAQFSRVFRRAARSADAYFTVLAHFRDEDGPRLGMAISRRTAKSAVARNRIKRLIRESFRHGCDRLPCADIVVISRPPAAAASNKMLTRSLETHWRRLRSRRQGEG